MSNSLFDGVKFGLGCIAGGVYVSYKSLKMFKLRRRMADIPKSKISSAAIGRNVEIHAKILCHAEDQVTSPLSKLLCSAYIWDFQELVSRGKSSNWVTRKYFYSTPFIYVSDDGKSIAAIDLPSCEFQEDIFDKGTSFTDRTLDISDEAKEILKEKDILDTSKTASFFSQTKYRIKEALLFTNMDLYVLGTGHIPPKTEQSLVEEHKLTFGSRSINLKAKIAKAFQQQLANPRTIAQFDKNGDGVLDKQEQNAVYMALEKKAMSISLNKKQNDYLSQARILFSVDNGATEFMKLDKVYVSKHSEQKVGTTLSAKAYLGLFGGPLLIVAGILILLNL